VFPKWKQKTGPKVSWFRQYQENKLGAPEDILFLIRVKREVWKNIHKKFGEYRYS
jgi:hypothetical protein